MRIFKLTGLALLAATTANAEFQDYHADIPGTGQGIAMRATKGGRLVMGST
ncbi:MAG: formylglycine-generating enzyme family protein, partial [Delftia sp.]|nr:formylglycine-generating enzyme family protein [Delftia sp.]